MSAAVDSAPSPLPGPAAVMARAGGENFPVAGLLAGRRRGEHLLAIYGFARLVDDTGDEADGDRNALLDWIEGDLDRLYDGLAPTEATVRRLASTVRALDLPAAPFRRLIEANRRDQVVDRYATLDALLDYCQLSAAPVGELVLHVFGSATPSHIALSDRVCSALQICEHLQDVAEDRGRGRVYLPLEDLDRFGCTIGDLSAPSPSPQLRAMLAFEVDRARSLLDAGAPLVRRLRGRAGLAVAGFVAGGRAALGAIERADYDVLSRRPRPSRAAFGLALAQTILERR